MTNEEMLYLAKRVVVVNYNENRAEEAEELTMENTAIVWFSKTLQNFKALVITTLPDDLYYEVTYDGDNNQIYLDVYNKIFNQAYNVEIKAHKEEEPAEEEAE